MADRGCVQAISTGKSEAHALLQATPVDDGSGFEDVQLAAEALALLFEVEDRGLAEDDAVDGAHW